jgi:hypothetical protein
MKDEGSQPRFKYPGRERDYDQKFVYEGRMFYGNCASGHPNRVIWFERYLRDDQQWHPSIFVAEIKDDNIVSAELRQGAPTVSDAEEMVRKGQCQELPGEEWWAEP